MGLEIKSFEETFPNFEAFEEIQIMVELIENKIEEPIQNNKKWQKLI